ncbi:hypothetical protein MHD_07785 [Mannheimia granulomatis]|uniref:Uncharacterized protein n=1 Tax=Mannheimia granulomatis TaxID=85402 RepID=A0A011P8E7_9PAST|nr:hypothetical protein [Mannheimia granulomatis]EXI62654.1 hypothetical protein AK33_04605 [Mannheimia granulomatis]RGE47851.1 hypothetical protein MHD_07785 [Mannheimia granulomatis]
MKYAEFDRYTDKNGVLLNKLGATSGQELELKEIRLVAMNTIGLRLEPVNGKFDLLHLQKYIKGYLVIFTNGLVN